MNNSLAMVHPELIAEWSEKNLPLTPDTVTYGSNKVMWWKGACGHEWQSSIKSRSAGEKCPICSGARVVEGINDLAIRITEMFLRCPPFTNTFIRSGAMRLKDPMVPTTCTKASAAVIPLHHLSAHWKILRKIRLYCTAS